jgi:hypothetical protein
MRGNRGRSALTIIAAAASIVALGACVHIPARALANGRELGYGTTMQVIYGDHNPASQRQLYSALQSSARGWQVTYRPYVPQFRR